MTLRDLLFWKEQARKTGLVPVAQERCNEIVEELRGTCKSLHEVCTDDELDNKFVTDAIDMELFECEVCGWWCEWSETSQKPELEGRFVCDDCEDDA